MCESTKQPDIEPDGAPQGDAGEGGKSGSTARKASSPAMLWLVGVFTLAVVAALVLMTGAGLRMTTRIAPQIHASTEIKSAVSLFHLWFEEFVQGDPTIREEEVWRLFGEAESHAHALLSGGHKDEDLPIPALADPDFRASVEKILNRLEKLKEVSERRIENTKAGFAGSAADQEFDRIFADVIMEADRLESALEKATSRELRQFRSISYGIGLAMVLLGAVVGFAFFRYERQRAVHIGQLREARNTFEVRVKERTAELEAANKEMEAFTYSVSHDLRTPLRGIDGFSRILLEEHEDKLNKTGRNYLRRVCAGSQKMGRLIDDLLKLSRSTRGEMTRRKLDLSALARDVAEGLHDIQPERNTEIDIADGLTVTGDERLLRVVLENLLGNAWKFTGHTKEARIELGAERRDNRSIYYVRDNGVGFDMTYANKLFGPFQRLHGASEFDGTGIGLATVQRIIHRHGGDIWAEAEVNKGAIFYFTL